MKLDEKIDKFAKGIITKDELIDSIERQNNDDKLNLVEDIIKERGTRYSLIRHRNDLMRKSMDIV